MNACTYGIYSQRDSLNDAADFCLQKLLLRRGDGLGDREACPLFGIHTVEGELSFDPHTHKNPTIK